MDMNTCNMKDKNCPFCCIGKDEREIILENESAVAIYDAYPVNKGHALIIPKRHCANYFEMSQTEKIDCWELVDKVKVVIDRLYHPPGYNVGINVNETAGQTIFHVHIHLIPRYVGDVEEPRGGVRGVVWERRGY